MIFDFKIKVEFCLSNEYKIIHLAYIHTEKTTLYHLHQKSAITFKYISYQQVFS